MSGKPFLLLILIVPVLLSAQEIEIVDFETLQPELQKYDDTVRIVNFWATWCVPCVQEMPYFIKASEKYQNKKVKFLFVSLDFPKNLESQVIPFIRKRKIKDKVILLDDPDANSWINQVDSSWSGAIPATLVYRGNKRSFVEGSIDYEELIKMIEPKL